MHSFHQEVPVRRNDMSSNCPRDVPETQVDQRIKDIIMRHNSEPQNVNTGDEEVTQELKSDMDSGNPYIPQDAD